MKSDSNDLSIALFIKKTFAILENPDFQAIIEWLPSGRQFAIRDPEALQSEILPSTFRHRNINSFIRQLNMYGFHKSRKDPSKNIFSNEHFLRGREDLLPLVRRKIKHQERGEENTPVQGSEATLFKSSCLVLPEERPVLGQNNENFEQPPMVKKESSQNEAKFQLSLNPSNNQLSLQSMICPSSVLNANPAEIYSNLHQNDQNYDESGRDDDKLSIDGEIEKERKVFRNRTSGVSLVQTRNLLGTHNDLSNPDI